MSIEIRRDILQDWPVLIVEDDPASMDVAAYMLRYYGAKVATATNGQEGLTQARATDPKFILTDMSMPIMDGWTMLEEMKKDRKLSSIPVIALTAHAMPGDRAKAIAAGCHNYLTKPLTAATFINNLLNLLVDIPEIKAALALSAPASETTAETGTGASSTTPAPETTPQAKQDDAPTAVTKPLNSSTVTPSAATDNPSNDKALNNTTAPIEEKR